MDRQAIIETNRSLRTIKNELEGLMEKGVIDDAGYENIVSLLPEETRLHGGAGGAARSANSTPAAEHAPPQHAPPAYNQTLPPSLPQRTQPAQQPPAPTKPVLIHARGLYRYQGPDPRDLHLDRDDQIAVHQYMNADWWMGTNLRTGQEGIFPRNYVHVEEKRGFQGQQQQGYSPMPHQAPMQQGPMAPVNPYNSHVPPMAIAEGSGGQEQQQQQQQQQQEGEGGGSKVEEHGKKFGKKLGNAAIFGAGATIGGNIVNSIF